MGKISLSEEIKKLCGIGPRYSFTEAAKPKDPAGVASKEYEGAPGTKKDGGDAGGGTGNKVAVAGGSKEAPGLNSRVTKAPSADKEGQEVHDGGGLKTASVGGAKEGPGQLDRTKRADAAEKEGGYADDGGGEDKAKTGGAAASKANRKDDGLRAQEHRESRMGRMRDLIALFDEEEEVDEEESDENLG